MPLSAARSLSFALSESASKVGVRALEDPSPLRAHAAQGPVGRLPRTLWLQDSVNWRHRMVHLAVPSGLFALSGSILNEEAPASIALTASAASTRPTYRPTQ